MQPKFEVRYEKARDWYDVSYLLRLVVVSGQPGCEYAFTAGAAGSERGERDDIFCAWHWFASSNGGCWHEHVERLTGFSAQDIISAWAEWQGYEV